MNSNATRCVDRRGGVLVNLIEKCGCATGGALRESRRFFPLACILERSTAKAPAWLWLSPMALFNVLRGKLDT